MKLCTKCQENKNLDCFYKKQSGNWCISCHKIYRNSRKERVSELSRIWFEKNKEKAILNKKLWRKNNMHLNRFYGLNRIAKKNKRNVFWKKELTDLVIIEAHHLAKLREKITKFKWHVDHIIPMNGKLVSGLHVWNNIQVIPASDNVRKHNKFEVQ